MPAFIPQQISRPIDQFYSLVLSPRELLKWVWKGEADFSRRSGHALLWAA